MNDNDKVKNTKKKLYWKEILDTKRRTLLPALQKLTDDQQSRYLAGGTALALYFGHRVSIDFDFFTEKDFLPNELLETVQKYFEGKTIKVLNSAKNTLTVLIDQVKVSFMSYHYPLLKPLTSTKYFKIASIEDIACMKFSAIQGRNTKKDYVDIAYLTRKLTLKKWITLYEKKTGHILQDSLFIRYILATDTLSETPIIFTDKEMDRITCVDRIQEWVKKEIQPEMSL